MLCQVRNNEEIGKVRFGQVRLEKMGQVRFGRVTNNSKLVRLCEVWLEIVKNWLGQVRLVQLTNNEKYVWLGSVSLGYK